MKLKTFMMMYAIFIILLSIVCIVGSAYLLRMSLRLKKKDDGTLMYSAKKEEINFMKSTIILIGFCQLIVVASVSTSYIKYIVPLSSFILLGVVIMGYALFDSNEYDGEYKLSEKMANSNLLIAISIGFIVNFGLVLLSVGYMLYSVVYKDIPIIKLPINPYLGELMGGDREDKIRRLEEQRDMLLEIMPPGTKVPEAPPTAPPMVPPTAPPLGGGSKEVSNVVPKGGSKGKVKTAMKGTRGKSKPRGTRGKSKPKAKW